jgi:uncharacterized cysteine cluster protein YcgN (CxxCxxCC family)
MTFWREKTLKQMSPTEWESLCDGCGKCCLHKIREATGELKLTTVACRLLDTQSCRCANYARRKTLVPDCVVLTAQSVRKITWLPDTCAYRLLAEGKDLPEWHPLVSGDPATVHTSGVSVRERVISERDAGPLHEHVVDVL